MPGLVPLLAIAAASTTINVPDTFGERVDRVKDRSEVRVLLPETMKVPFKKVHPDSSSRKGSYQLYLGAVKGCNGSTACFVAGFLADRGAETFGGSKVSLAKGRRGYYTPSTCGASCSAEQIQWRERKVLYTVQVKGGSKRKLVRLANSAIRKGAR